ncbi:MAG: Gfo/Idh/MocA family oxidoreductase [candidate division KSB1 bacterium]|nr:Gfo/Idh/MocA family oxidoreductase [candidate division KSB1 bacterium]
MSSFRFVIIGTGNISQTYWQVIENLDQAEVAGFVSRSLTRPDYVPKDRPVEIQKTLVQIESSYHAVIVTTPNGLHHRGAIDAAALNKHVLVEKPLDINRENMAAMLQACRHANVKLGVAYQRRMSRDNQTIKQLLDEGKLGRVYAADLWVKFWRGQDYYDSAPYRGGREIDGGGPFIQQACHNVDIYCWFFGKPDKVVSMTDTFAHRIQAEDHGAVLLRHPNGMIGSMVASTVAWPGYAPELQVHAEKGSFSMKNDIISVWDVPDLENPSECQGQNFHSGAGSAAVTQTAGHETIVRDFIEAVQQNRKPCVPGEEAKLATEVILDIYGNTV